jgi:hypothetical protein
MDNVYTCTCLSTYFAFRNKFAKRVTAWTKSVERTRPVLVEYVFKVPVKTSNVEKIEIANQIRNVSTTTAKQMITPFLLNGRELQVAKVIEIAFKTPDVSRNTVEKFAARH